jgi:hypothetical protein
MNDITYCMNQMCLDYISCRLRVQLKWGSESEGHPNEPKYRPLIYSDTVDLVYDMG